jgi:hypothetical protein
MVIHRRVAQIGPIVPLAVLAALATAGAAGAGGAVVTRGEIAAFATSSDPAIAGRAQMVRTPDGRTIVVVHVVGLAPNTTYPAHVHQQACADGAADGHYRLVPAGPAARPNEIWASFTTNAAGIGSGWAEAPYVAGPNAVSLVVHSPGGAKIACADLT